jgi:hypothetical protein
LPPTDIRAELKALTDEFFRAVSFESGQRPAYARIDDLFIDGGKLIRNSSELPEITSVDEFIASRQRMVDSGALTSFEELETAETAEVFGNIAHRFSTYEKRGTMGGEAIEGPRCHLDAVHPHARRMEDELDGVGRRASRACHSRSLRVR